jgi:hypothetical protein
VPSLRHALSAAAFAVVGLAACDGKADDTALRVAAGATVASTAAPTSAPTAATPTSESPAPPTRVTASTIAPDRSAAGPTTPRATKAPRIAAPASTSRSTPATSKSTPAGADASVAGQVLTLVNAERARAGCKPVVLDDRLTRAAAGHSQDMAADDTTSDPANHPYADDPAIETSIRPPFGPQRHRPVRTNARIVGTLTRG